MATHRPSYYAVIPASVRYADIPPNAKLLFGEITALCSKEGYCWASNNHFAELYGVTRQTVSGWVALLERHGFIAIRIEQEHRRKIFLCGKWVGGCKDFPRGVEGKPDTPLQGKPDKSTTRKSTTKKGDYSPDFLAFWEAYPRRVAKLKAWKAWSARLKEPIGESGRLHWTPGLLIRCAQNYAAVCKKADTDVQYVMHAATFLGPSERWLDYERVKDEKAPVKKRHCPKCNAEQPAGYTGAMCMACHEEMGE